MKCDISNNMTYALLFATAATVTVVAKTTVLLQTPKLIIEYYRIAHPEAAKCPQKYGKITPNLTSTPNHIMSDSVKSFLYLEGQPISIAPWKYC